MGQPMLLGARKIQWLAILPFPCLPLVPVMTATDRTFGWGQIGLGSFDDTGFWDDIRLYGEVMEAPMP